MIEPWQSLVVPGWRKDAGNVAAFEFSSTRDSYNQHNATGQAGNIGVIGCKVFNEVYKFQQTIQPIHYHYHYKATPPQYYSPNTFIYPNYRDNNPKYWGGMGYSVNTVMCSSVGAKATNGVLRSAQLNQQAEESPSANIGTGWGENKKFETVQVNYDFEKNAYTTLLIYYDDRRGLVRRGIDLNTKIKIGGRLPNAFPSDGCPPPI